LFRDPGIIGKQRYELELKEYVEWKREMEDPPFFSFSIFFNLFQFRSLHRQLKSTKTTRLTINAGIMMFHPQNEITWK